MKTKTVKINLVFFVCVIVLSACGGDTADKPAQNSVQENSEVGEQVQTANGEVKASEQGDLKDIIKEAGVRAEDTVTSVKSQAKKDLAVIQLSADNKVNETIAVALDKPYQIIDGKISANVMEGWKTYNGGGCGACHGKGATGSVGPNIGESVTTKLSKEEFKSIVINGVPGSLMRSNKLNKRVMDNLDNLYAYLVARGDGTLGPGNLIKLPFGKPE
jgi:mono/diheme cytochrome c family protein